MTENWLIATVVAAWLVARLAQILATYRTSRRRDEMKTRPAS